MLVKNVNTTNVLIVNPIVEGVENVDMMDVEEFVGHAQQVNIVHRDSVTVDAPLLALEKRVVQMMGVEALVKQEVVLLMKVV